MAFAYINIFGFSEFPSLKVSHCTAVWGIHTDKFHQCITPSKMATILNGFLQPGLTQQSTTDVFTIGSNNQVSHWKLYWHLACIHNLFFQLHFSMQISIDMHFITNSTSHNKFITNITFSLKNQSSTVMLSKLIPPARFHTEIIVAQTCIHNEILQPIFTMEIIEALTCIQNRFYTGKYY